MKHLTFPILLAWVLLFAPGCASIVSRSNYPVMINSNPSEAEVTVSDRYGQIYATGVTPLTVNLKSSSGFFQKASYILTISKPGYQEMTLPLNTTIDGWYFGNILLGGLVGMLIVDPATGAMWRLETDYVHVNLAAASGRGSKSELIIMEIDELSEEMKAQLLPLN